jgi:alpha,alpha-trehalose phosphorylase
VAGFGGMRDHDGSLSFAPRLPPALARIAFRMCLAGARLLVEVEPEQATYALLEGDSLELSHHGESITVSAQPVVRPIPRLPSREEPVQPAGRAPARRRATEPGRG